MSNPEQTGDINREADSHLNLGNLLKKERDSRSRELVTAVLDRGIPVADKIQEIRKIDSQAAATRALAAREETEDKPGKDPETVAQPLAHNLHTIKSVLKVPHSRVSYFEYLFRNRGKVRLFARLSHVLSLGGVFPRVRLNPEVHKVYREELQPLASATIDLCDRAMEHGWLSLDKFDYNLIVLLRRLCFEISAVNFKVLNYKDKNLVDHMRNLETYFLVMHYRPEYKDRVTRAMIRGLASDPEWAGESDRVTLSVARLLSDDLMLPSLHHFLLGINIVKLRRMVTLDDLICRDLGPIVNTKDFACSPATQQRIQDQVQSLQKQLIALQKQKLEIEHLRQVLRITAGGTPDYSPIQSMYDRAATRGDSQHFLVDQDNLMLFAPRFLKSFDDTFFPLLGGRIRVGEIGMINLFANDYFPTQFHRLRQVTAETAKLNFSLHVFTRARFITLKKTGKGAVAAETHVLQQLDEAVRLILEIATRVEEVLASPLRRTDETLRAVPNGALIVPDREFSLPSKEQRLLTKDSIDDKPVGEALKFLILVSYAVGAFLMDRPILLTLERNEKVETKIQQSLSELQRIGDPAVFSDDARVAELAATAPVPAAAASEE